MLPNKIYDILKWVAIIVLPALNLFLLDLTDIWGFGDTGVKIAKTVAAVGVLLAAVIGASSYNYKKANKATIETEKEE